jgi:hypothetical protein
MKKLVTDHPHDISQALHSLVGKGFLQREGTSSATFYYLAGQHPVQDEMSGAHGGISDRFPEKSEHLTGNSEHREALQLPAQPVRRSSKASRDVGEQTILQVCSGSYLSLDELSRLLGRTKDSRRNHYENRMIEEGRLIQKVKNAPSHPGQGYMAVGDEGQDGS